MTLPILRAILFSTVFAVSSFAQEPTVTIQKSAELVTIPVLITDKSGKPVHGLTKQDFTVIEDGKTSRSIAVFDELKSVTGPVVAAQSKEPGFSNFASSDGQPRRVTIIVLDMVNTPFIAQAHVRSDLLKFLSASLHDDEPMALLIIGRNGLRQIHAITTSPQVLVAALRNVSGQVSSSDTMANSAAMSQASAELNRARTEEEKQLSDFRHQSDGLVEEFQEREAIRTTLQALEQIGQAFSGVPGRKTLIWASGGFPFLIEDRMSILGFGTDTLADYDRTWRALNSANIAVYPIDALGLSNSVYNRQFDPTRRFPSPPAGAARSRFPESNTQSVIPRYDRVRQTQDTLRAFANATGGVACLDRNDLSNCFREAQQDSDSYYMLGYYLPTDQRKPGWHKLKVSVNQSHVQVRARTGFLIPDPTVVQKEDTRKTEVLTALGSAVDYTMLHLFVTWGEFKPDQAHPDRVFARFRVSLPPNSLTVDVEQNNHINLDIAALALTDNMKEGGEYTKTVDAKLKPETLASIRAGGLKFFDVISLPKGRFTVKFVVRDNLGGRIGTVTAPIEVN
jgi:VWFA-related protein